MRNHEVTTAQKLLDEQGNIAEPGWARHLVWDYDKTQVKAPWYRLKEWDYYMVVSKDFAIALTLSDVGYMGVQTVSFFWLGDEPHVATNSSVNPLPHGAMGLAANSDMDNTVEYKGYRLRMKFSKTGDRRHLTCDFANFSKFKKLVCDITLHEDPKESIVVATPWPEDKHFYYNQKINCMRAEGYVEYDGTRYEFDPASDFATLDWGRGVWTYDNTWYWSSGNAQLSNGHVFGFNLGYGFADTSAATENVIIYDGIAHKLDDVTFAMSDPKNFLAPWTFTSSDGRFETEFTPILDRKGKIDVGFAATDQHQVFGRMNGRAVLDDGTEIEIKDLLCFVEKVRMKY